MPMYYGQTSHDGLTVMMYLMPSLIADGKKNIYYINKRSFIKKALALWILK